MEEGAWHGSSGSLWKDAWKVGKNYTVQAKDSDNYWSHREQSVFELESPDEEAVKMTTSSPEARTDSYSSRKLELLYEGSRVLAFARGLQSSRTRCH